MEASCTDVNKFGRSSLKMRCDLLITRYLSFAVLAVCLFDPTLWVKRAPTSIGCDSWLLWRRALQEKCRGNSFRDLRFTANSSSDADGRETSDIVFRKFNTSLE
jgi:hypothetical protein